MFLATGFMSMQDVELWRTLGLYYVDSPHFRPYQIITHMFMHGSIMHIFFNMFALWMFGGPLENVWGAKRFLLYYFITGLGAAFLHQLVTGIEVYQQTGTFFPGIDSPFVNEKLYVSLFVPTVGASGAVFGLLLGFGMLFPNTRLFLIFLPIPIKAKYFVIGYALIEIYLGFQQIPGDNIAHFAHVGGMLFGFILLKLWQRDRNRFY